MYLLWARTLPTAAVVEYTPIKIGNDKSPVWCIDIDDDDDDDDDGDGDDDDEWNDGDDGDDGDDGADGADGDDGDDIILIYVSIHVQFYF